MDQLEELFEDVKKLYQSNDDLQMIREAKVNPTCLLYPILERGSTVQLLLLLLCHAQGTPLDSETGWTGELWSKTNLLNWQN